jgi:hypothetical protein
MSLTDPEDLCLAIGEGRSRERDGDIGSYFREAPHGVMQTHATAPPPNAPASADHFLIGRQGRDLGYSTHKTIPKWAGSLAA